MEYLYHGSKLKGLKLLEPSESGHAKSFVYAVSEPAFAAIFINRSGGSLVQKWGRNKAGVPYLVERKENVIDTNYKNVSGSIYKVDKNLFSQNENLWKEEWVSQKPVSVLEEIVIHDLKDYLHILEIEGKLQIIYYKDRLTYFPSIDIDLIDDAKKLIEKYGKAGLETINTHRPELLKLL